MKLPTLQGFGFVEFREPGAREKVLSPVVTLLDVAHRSKLHQATNESNANPIPCSLSSAVGRTIQLPRSGDKAYKMCELNNLCTRDLSGVRTISASLMPFVCIRQQGCGRAAGAGVKRGRGGPGQRDLRFPHNPLCRPTG